MAALLHFYFAPANRQIGEAPPPRQTAGLPLAKREALSAPPDVGLGTYITAAVLSPVAWRVLGHRARHLGLLGTHRHGHRQCHRPKS